MYTPLIVVEDRQISQQFAPQVQRAEGVGRREPCRGPHRDAVEVVPRRLVEREVPPQARGIHCERQALPKTPKPPSVRVLVAARAAPHLEGGARHSRHDQYGLPARRIAALMEQPRGRRPRRKHIRLGRRRRRDEDERRAARERDAQEPRHDAHPEQRAAAAEASRLRRVKQSRSPCPRGQHRLLDRRKRGDLLRAALGHDAPLVLDGQGRPELAFHLRSARGSA